MTNDAEIRRKLAEISAENRQRRIVERAVQDLAGGVSPRIVADELVRQYGIDRTEAESLVRQITSGLSRSTARRGLLWLAAGLVLMVAPLVLGSPNTIVFYGAIAFGLVLLLRAIALMFPRR